MGFNPDTFNTAYHIEKVKFPFWVTQGYKIYFLKYTTKCLYLFHTLIFIPIFPNPHSPKTLVKFRTISKLQKDFYGSLTSSNILFFGGTTSGNRCTPREQNQKTNHHRRTCGSVRVKTRQQKELNRMIEDTNNIQPSICIYVFIKFM